MANGVDYWQLKLRRADEHLQSLDAEIGRLVESCYHGIVAQQELDGDTLQFRRVLGISALPASELLGALVGDFVGNLRASLDHLVSVLTWDHSDELLDGTDFPIFADRPKYNRRHNAGGPYRIRGTAPAAQAIIERLQPYHRGKDAPGHPLWIIHQLANVDKHSITPWFWMHTVNSAPAILSSADMEILSLESLTVEGPVNTGTQFSLITARITGDNPRMEMQDNVEFEIRFDQDTAAPGQPVGEVCHGLRDFVRDEVYPLFDQFHRSPVIVQMSEAMDTSQMNPEDLPWRWQDLEDTASTEME